MGAKVPHDEPVYSGVPGAPGAVAVRQQAIHDAQLLADRIAADDGGMLIDFEESQWRRRRRSTGGW